MSTVELNVKPWCNSMQFIYEQHSYQSPTHEKMKVIDFNHVSFESSIISISNVIRELN